MLFAASGCAEQSFSEGEPIDEECGSYRTIMLTGSTSLEIGHLQSGTFVPLTDGAPLELSVSGDPFGWGFTAALRFSVQGPPPTSQSCGSVSALVNGVQTPFPSPGYPVRFVNDSASTLGQWVTVGEPLIVVGTDLGTLTTSMTKMLVVTASVEGAPQLTPPLNVRFTNNEGFLAE